MPVYAAVDLGASGGRVIAGTVDGDDIHLEAVHRFPNGAAERDGHLRWDLTGLYEQVLTGLRRIPDAVSIGIDTWGVDYGLLDVDRRLLAEPVAYRDDRTNAVIGQVHATIPPEELYRLNGLQHLPFTTIYQLAAEREGPLWDRVAHVVLLPDLVAHWLTGELGTELTNASTTGLLDARSKSWSSALLDRIEVDARVLPDLRDPGTVRGSTADGVPVTTVASHDTASAVVGVPATSPHFAYVACGTWSLVGLELDAPVLTSSAREANFTNEVGLEGRTRFLRNVGGLWLLQECLRTWQRDDLDHLLAAAGKVAGGGPRIDVDDPAFIPPGGMPQRIADHTGRPSLTPPETVRCIIDSLAWAYARTIHQAVELAGRSVDVIHVVGGGSQNELLCQLTADFAQLPVLSGPVEATALGNILVQARTHEQVPSSLEEIRERLAAAVAVRRYDPT